MITDYFRLLEIKIVYMPICLYYVYLFRVQYRYRYCPDCLVADLIGNFYLALSWIRIFSVPDPGTMGKKDTGFRIRNTAQH